MRTLMLAAAVSFVTAGVAIADEIPAITQVGIEDGDNRNLDLTVGGLVKLTTATQAVPGKMVEKVEVKVNGAAIKNLGVFTVPMFADGQEQPTPPGGQTD